MRGAVTTKTLDEAPIRLAPRGPATHASTVTGGVAAAWPLAPEPMLKWPFTASQMHVPDLGPGSQPVTGLWGSAGRSNGGVSTAPLTLVQRMSCRRAND